MAAAITLVVGAPAAEAHPLGNFTVNRYARVEASAAGLRVYYVLDEAEIPAFQERDAVAGDPEGFAAGRAREIAAHLTLTVDGVPAPLAVEARHLSQPPGQGGLRTLRLAVLFRAAVAAGGADDVHQAELADDNEPGRVGWREIVVTARGDGRVLRSDAPRRDQSDELRRYPADLIKSPLDLRRASFAFTTGTEQVAPLPISGRTAALVRSGSRFTNLLTRTRVSAPVLAGMLAIAVSFGAAHALAPGHGKTVMAAYLAGTRGRPRDAVMLGVVVSAMHTASVLVLGVVLFNVSRSTSLERVYPALTLASGGLVLALGAWLLRGRLRSLRAGAVHSHDHSHDHAHDHAHGEDPEPAAVVADPPLSRRGLAVLAGSGGLVPSPSAVVVLLSAFSQRRIGLGLGLVSAFSVGLAASLTAVGLALVYGRDVVQRRMGRSLAFLPVAGAVALVVVGLVLCAQGFRTL